MYWPWHNYKAYQYAGWLGCYTWPSRRGLGWWPDVIYLQFFCLYYFSNLIQCASLEHGFSYKVCTVGSRIFSHRWSRHQHKWDLVYYCCQSRWNHPTYCYIVHALIVITFIPWWGKVKVDTSPGCQVASSTANCWHVFHWWDLICLQFVSTNYSM